MKHIIQTVASPEDYEWSSFAGAYIMRERAFAPGNPAHDPQAGAAEFNQWLATQNYPAHSSLDYVICLAKRPGESGRRTSALLLNLLQAKDPAAYSRAIAQHELTDFPYGCVLLFCHDEIMALKAADKLSLRNELMLRCSDQV